MGMSASQARLLSLTTRMTNNEFRAQTITNSKLRLADKSTEASQEYMDALNNQKLVYNFYNDNGEFTQQNLTPGLVYTYSPLKNQYAMVNNAGRMLVTSQDAKNYEETSNLFEFLHRYKLVDNLEPWEDYKRQMADYNAQMDIYNKKMEQYLKDLDQYNKDMEKFIEDSKKPNLYDEFVKIVGTSDNPQSCYMAGRGGSIGCFSHLLDCLINFDGVKRRQQDLTTTTGIDFTTWNNGGATLDGSPDPKVSFPLFKQLSAQLGSKKCDGWDDDGYKEQKEPKYNLLEDKKNKGEEITEFDILRSDYKDDGKGNYTELKTLKEKAIDMYYILMNLGYGSGAISDKFKTEFYAIGTAPILDNFTDGDMKNFAVRPELKTPRPVEPVEPEPPIYKMEILDKAKGQWYINLWHMMNGSETANLVEKIDYEFDIETGTDSDTTYTVKDAAKDVNKSNYEIIDDNLLNSNTWLQFALEHGAIQLRQADYYNPSADSGKTPEITSKGIYWKSITFSSAPDLSQVDDDVAIARAEVKYKEAVREIEAQDKKYDQDLKKLDTEHTALQTEYESLKSVISKNVERSFKAFS